MTFSERVQIQREHQFYNLAQRVLENLAVIIGMAVLMGLAFIGR